MKKSAKDFLETVVDEMEGQGATANAFSAVETAVGIPFGDLTENKARGKQRLLEMAESGELYRNVTFVLKRLQQSFA